MPRFSRKEQAICPSCGDWKTTDFTPEELKEKEWECSDCANKRLTNPADLPENRGSKEVSKYDPEYIFLVKLIKLVTAEGIPPQEVKALAEAYPFVTVDDVGNLAAKIWTLATEKYKIPREWLISKLPKNASLVKKADLKEYSNEETKGINDFIIQHPKVMEVVIDAAKRATDEKSFTDWLQEALTGEGMEEGVRKAVRWEELGWAWFNTVNRETTEPTSTDVIEKLPTLDKKKKLDDLLDSLSVETDPQKKEQIKQHIERIKRAKLLRADLWPSQEEAEDMLNHAPGYLAYEYGQDKTSKSKKLNINKIVQILNAKEPLVANIDTVDCTITLLDGTVITFDEAAKQALSMDKTADVFQGSEFSGIDSEPNPLMDIGPWSSPQDHGAKPQKSPFPNTNWLPADAENLDQQPASNVAASLNKQALAQQDVVDFYLMSLLPEEYLSKEVSPDHYDALAVFKTIIQSLRDEYIERGMHELKDEARTTQWVKAIADYDMPEQIKPYYTYHDEPFRGHRDPDSEEEDFDSQPRYAYSCDSCGVGLDEDGVYFFNDDMYCESCESEAIHNAIQSDVAFCETHKVFVTDNRSLKDYLHGYKFDSWDKHHENGECKVIRFDAGKAIWAEMQENAKKQLELFVKERKERKPSQENAVTEKDLDVVCATCGQKGGVHPITGECPNGAGIFKRPAKQLKLPEASVKQAGEGGSSGQIHSNGDGWWEAPRDFSGYTSLDYYNIFKYAPWKHLYGGPLWAEVAKTVYDMQKTTAWDKLVVLIDHFHDLGHNTGKLLDKFPEWHKWFKNLLDQKAKKNSIRYLMPKASKPVQNLVSEYLRVHGKPWREDEGGETKEEKGAKYYEGEEVLFAGKPAKVKSVAIDTAQPTYFIELADGSSRWAWEEDIQGMPSPTSSLNRPFSKKALLKEANPQTRYWIAPDGKEFPVSGIHPIWLQDNPKILKQYGINPKQATYEIHNQLIAQGWSRISTEKSGFQIEIADLHNLPSYLDDFIAKNFQRGDEILIGNGKERGVFVRDPFPTIQKAVNKQLLQNKASLKEADLSGQVVNTILEAIELSGGITYNLSKGNLGGSENYAVSIYPDREKIVEGPIDFDTLEGYLLENQNLLQDLNNSFGAWTNGNQVYLDVVVTVPDRDKALELGKRHNQLAIWDLKNNQEISTGVVRAFSKKTILKRADNQILTPDQQNEIAAASSPIYNIALNNYAQAVKRGHDKNRSLAYAIESVKNVEKIDEKKLVEFINNYLTGLVR